MKKKIVKQTTHDSSTCAGCGGTSLYRKLVPVKGGGAELLCPACRTEPGHAFLSKPQKMETGRRK